MPELSHPPGDRDRRDIVTPYAFQVHPRVLGLPLASPRRRLAAIAIDGLAVGLLATAPGGILTIAASLVLLRWAAQPDVRGKALRRRLLRWTAALLAMLGLWSLYGNAVTWTTQPIELGANATVELEGPAPEPEREREPVYSVLQWARGLLDDLGIGLGWAALYFTAFCAWWNGQTPGKRLLGIRVVQLDASPMSMWEAFERYGGYGAGFATGLLGFLQVYWDANRQAIHDKICETVVIRGDVPRGAA